MYDVLMQKSINEQVEQQTLHWVKDFIVKLNICPFAKHVVNNQSLKIQVYLTTDEVKALDSFMSTLELMDKTPAVETTLLVYPQLFTDFFDYLDFVDWAEAHMHRAGYEGVYQIATFHPHYCFEGEPTDSLSHYTNRSPYPMLHILREESLDKAIDFYGDTSQIPANNLATINNLSSEEKLRLTLRCTAVSVR